MTALVMRDGKFLMVGGAFTTCEAACCPCDSQCAGVARPETFTVSTIDGMDVTGSIPLASSAGGLDPTRFTCDVTATVTQTNTPSFLAMAWCRRAWPTVADPVPFASRVFFSSVLCNSSTTWDGEQTRSRTQSRIDVWQGKRTTVTVELQPVSPTVSNRIRVIVSVTARRQYNSNVIAIVNSQVRLVQSTYVLVGAACSQLVDQTLNASFGSWTTCGSTIGIESVSVTDPTWSGSSIVWAAFGCISSGGAVNLRRPDTSATCSGGSCWGEVSAPVAPYCFTAIRGNGIVSSSGYSPVTDYTSIGLGPGSIFTCGEFFGPCEGGWATGAQSNASVCDGQVPGASFTVAGLSPTTYNQTRTRTATYVSYPVSCNDLYEPITLYRWVSGPYPEDMASPLPAISETTESVTITASGCESGSSAAFSVVTPGLPATLTLQLG